MTTWTPSEARIAAAEVSALGRTLGCPDYDALYRLSIERPDVYWNAAMRFLGIVWSRPPDAHVDLAEGPAFPRWFPGGELNWVDSVFAWADDPRTRAHPAIVAEKENGETATIDFAELRRRTLAFAGGLRHAGLARGDRIGLLMEGGIEAVVSFLAIAAIGAITVPLFSGFGSEAIVARLAGCGAVALIATAGFDRRGRRIHIASLIAEIRPALPALATVVIKGEAVPNTLLWSALQSAPPIAAAARMAANDPFMVIYTSGTTGRPKGAVHIHGGFPLKIAHDAAIHFDLAPGDVFCWPADMGWVAGALTLAAALLRGATLVCYDGAPDFPAWSRMARLVASHRVTHFGASPTLIRGLAANAPACLAANLDTIRLLITAGEGIDPEHFTWFQRHFGRATCPLINYTGGTEVSGALLAGVLVRPIVPAGFNSVSPGVQADVLGEDGRPLRDRVGELAILAPFVGMTQAFWQDRARYLDTYWSRFDGIWIHGDLALRRADGVFFLRGRSDDTLKIAGKRLGSAEIEEIVLELPTVREAAAIGVDDTMKGQRLVVFAVAEAAAALPDEIARHVERRMGRAFRPAAVHLVAELPKTRSLKVMRRVVRNLYTGQPPGDLSALDNPASLEPLRALAISSDDSRSGKSTTPRAGRPP